MQLEILLDNQTLEGMEKCVNEYFGQQMRIIQEKMSMFETYQVRPCGTFIPGIWKYRIVCRNGKYYFGTIKL